MNVRDVGELVTPLHNASLIRPQRENRLKKNPKSAQRYPRQKNHRPKNRLQLASVRDVEEQITLLQNASRILPQRGKRLRSNRIKRRIHLH